MTKLVAPVGTDEANFGGERFRVDNDGTVDVPQEAVPSLLAVGGFEVPPVPVDIPDGTCRMRSTIGPQGVSFEGQSYQTDADDVVVVPLAAVDALLSHDFELIETADGSRAE